MTVTMPSEEKMRFWQERKIVRLELRTAITETQRLFNTQDADTISKFVDAIEPTTTFDLGRLPYHSRNKGHASHPTKPHCVFALIAEAIMRYWRFVQIEDCDLVDGVTATIEAIRHTTEHYEEFGVIGNPRYGYYMVLPDSIIKYQQCETCGRSPLGVPIGDKTCKECLNGEESIEERAEKSSQENDEGTDSDGMGETEQQE